MKKFFAEFKAFAMKGNVVDMAVGVVIGSAFTAIVSSLVGDIFTPLIGIITGGIHFAGLSIKVGDATLAYGNFIQAIIQFVLIAFCVFMLVKAVNRLTAKKQEPAPEPEPVPTKEELLLTEIRDLLAKK
ncbi:MAG: large-conductance mechanosensitive channel protein MscL [Ruthenibacterium sp.]